MDSIPYPYDPTRNPPSGYETPHSIDTTPGGAPMPFSKKTEEFIDLRASSKLARTLRQLDHARKWNRIMAIVTAAAMSAAFHFIAKDLGGILNFIICYLINVVLFFWLFAELTRKIK